MRVAFLVLVTAACLVVGVAASVSFTIAGKRKKPESEADRVVIHGIYYAGRRLEPEEAAHDGD